LSGTRPTPQVRMRMLDMSNPIGPMSKRKRGPAVIGREPDDYWRL
jgi:hypothetical protein